MASGYDDLTDDLLSQILASSVDGTTTGKTGPFPVSKNLHQILSKDDFTVEMLVARHGGEEALMRLAKLGRKKAMKRLLTWKAMPAIVMILFGSHIRPRPATC